MKLLILNIGSSSIKYSVFYDEIKLYDGIIERIKDRKSCESGLREIIRILEKSKVEIDTIGHRVVHGGKTSESCIIKPKVLAEIKKCTEFAPAHNLPQTIGIELCARLFKNIPQVALFDTAFHQTMPEKAFLYGIPYHYYLKYGIRRYGFHGISHRYVMKEAAKVLGRSLHELKIISCHLGNGSSITAIHNGKSVDTSMGFTPMEGLVMGTRSGDLDPAIILYLMEKERIKPADMKELLNQRSGLKGISGTSNDLRDLVNKKDARAKLAVDIFCYRAAKYIGAYCAVLNGADALVFTAGIGENRPSIRKQILDYFQYLGITVDEQANKKNEQCISTVDSRIAVFVIPTNEALEMARECKRVLQ